MSKFLKMDIFFKIFFLRKLSFLFQIEIKTFSYQEAETLPELGSPQS